MKHIWLTTVVLVAATFLGGCSTAMKKRFGKMFETSKYRFMDSSKVIVPHEGSPVTPIYANSGDADITDELPPNATPPTPEDLTYSDRDYIIGPTDVLDISVLDLLENGVETVLRRQVTTSGHIDLPLLPERLKVEGLNKEQLTETIKDVYSRDVLKNPIVSVTIAARRQSTYSILDAVASPGTYQIERRDMRLLNALAAARGITQQNIRYIYVIRPQPAKVLNPTTTGTKGAGPAVAPVAASRTAPPPASRPGTATAPKKTTGSKVDNGDTSDALRELGNALTGNPGDAPKTKPADRPGKKPVDTTPAPVVMPTFAETSSVAAAASTSAEAGPQADGLSEKWIFVDGKWIKSIQKAPVATQPSGRGAPTVTPVRVLPRTQKATPVVRRRRRDDPLEDPYQWKDADRSNLARVIFIDLQRLLQGDARLNIVIRDNDIIRVPSLEVGEFYVMGEVQRPGVYTLTGRKVTIKMALAAAGNLNALAYPENSTLVRRIGRDQEQTTAINVRAIVAGTEPDQFLKPNDVLEIGTHWKTSFLAVVRNAFRVSYGFGMIYDRNFGAARRAGEQLDGYRFSRW
ncbi:MAG: polysaccharide biosynthesis/export family protein [Phycisphaerae bacterium]|nr:polysaccharide biosynthesis/export family protein [Phycisphaerae bacterium]